MSQTSAARDVIQFALAALQSGAAPAEPRPTGYCARRAALQLCAGACAATAFGCGLAALWIYASSALGAAGGLLLVSTALCAAALAAFVAGRRAGEPRARSADRSPAAGDALLAGGSRFLRQYPVLALIAAAFAGVLLAGQN